MPPSSVTKARLEVHTGSLINYGQGATIFESEVVDAALQLA
jgi:hypothetical protein